LDARLTSTSSDIVSAAAEACEVDRTLADDTRHEDWVVRRGQWWAILRLAVAIAFRPTRRNILHWLSMIGAVGMELLLVVVLQDDHIYAWERAVTRWLQQVPIDLDVYRTVSMLTNTLAWYFIALFIVIVGVVILTRHWLDAFLLLLTFPIHVLAQFPKALIDRPRPPAGDPSILGPGGMQSFPSGHAEYVISFYGFLALLVVQHLERRWQRVAVVTVFALFALSVGIGRISMGRHWPIDILASYLFGAAILSGILWLRYSIRQAMAITAARTSTDEA
jgi:undecaprenyl-diphosphatase